jgi:hypothetical protein
VKNYYNAYGGGQQLPYYYAYVAAGSPGAYNYYGHDGPLQIPKMTQHPHLPPMSVTPSATATGWVSKQYFASSSTA